MATSQTAYQTAATRSEETYFTRFSLAQRVEHAALMVSFIVLSVTGLAQRFDASGWGAWVILNLGGIETTRLAHRIFGFLFTASAIYHFGYVAHCLFVRHNRASMLPSLNDVRDVVDVLRYSFGFSDSHPRFGRYTYEQKFEYWGIIFGGLIMIITGFFLMYPTFFTSALPGQFIAAAKEFHRNEAMLAVLTVVVWHLYDTIFKPSIFPMDASIFTGKISLKRMTHEHPLELDEIEKTATMNERTSAAEKTPSDSAAR